MAIPLAAIGAISSAASVTGKLGLGLVQLFSGLSKKPKRPTYSVPGAAREALDRARSDASQLSAEFTAGNRALDRAASANVQQVADAGVGGSSVVQAAAAAQNARADASNGLVAQESRRQLAAGQAYQGAADRVAAHENYAFQVNKLQPYQAAAAERSRLIGGGLQNIFGATNDLGRQSALAQADGYGQANAAAPVPPTYAPNLTVPPPVLPPAPSVASPPSSGLSALFPNGAAGEYQRLTTPPASWMAHAYQVYNGYPQ